MQVVEIMWRWDVYLLFIIVFLASCTSTPQKDESPKDEEPYSQDRTLALSEQKQEVKVHIVEIKEMRFQPSEVKVHKGEKVLWINKDITDHDVMEQTTRAWASSPLAKGASWSMEVTQSAEYYCNLHQVMKGKIIVE